METNKFENLSKKPSEQGPAVALLIQYFLPCNEENGQVEIVTLSACGYFVYLLGRIRSVYKELHADRGSLFLKENIRLSSDLYINYV